MAVIYQIIFLDRWPQGLGWGGVGWPWGETYRAVMTLSIDDTVC